MSTAYTAHVTLRDATVRRVDVPQADSREHACTQAMARFNGAARKASAWPVDRAPVTIDSRVRTEKPVMHFDSAFGCLA